MKVKINYTVRRRSDHTTVRVSDSGGIGLRVLLFEDSEPWSETDIKRIHAVLYPHHELGRINWYVDAEAVFYA